MKYQFYPKCFPLHTFMKNYVIKYSDDEFIDISESNFADNNDYDYIKRKIKSVVGNINAFFGKDKLKPNYDAFYSAGCYYDGDKPWVLDVYDNIYGITGYNYKLFINNLDKIRKTLSKENCIKIICRSQTTWDLLYKYFNSPEVMRKVILEKPILPEKKYQKKEGGTFNLLFLASINNEDDFYQKGGHYAIEILETLQKEHNVKLYLRGRIPTSLLKKLKNNNIVYMRDRISDKLLDELYKKTDCLLALNQTFVMMTTLEAQSSGIPIIALDTSQVKDYITNVIPAPKNMEKFYKADCYPTNIRTSAFVNELKKIDKSVVHNACKKIERLINDRKRKIN